jgi:hypothetical protein
MAETDPFAVKTREAGRLGGHGKTKTFLLIKSGEYESYLDGRVRMVVTASIRARINRKLKESGATTKDTRSLTEASLRKRARQKAQAEGDTGAMALRTEDRP